jgi:hypothetical protein
VSLIPPYSRQYFKANKINYSHLNAIRRAFLDVDENGEKLGIISKREFLLKVSEDGFSLPLEFLIYFIQDVQLDSNDLSEEAKLSFENVKTIIDIFNQSPCFEK